MEYIMFGARFSILLLLCFILLRSLRYFILQVGFYYKSRHLTSFLEKKEGNGREVPLQERKGVETQFQECTISARWRFQGVHP